MNPAYRANYYEQELEEELGEVDLDLAIGNYGQNGVNAMYDEAHTRLAEATIAAMQQQIAQQTFLAQVPDAVKRFIVHFYQAILENNISEISAAYESGWNRLTEKFYAKSEWPEAEVIAPLVDDHQIFLILYRELYYRHVYSRLSPNIEDRFHSYENSCELFNYLLNSDGPVALDLPDQWLWDIIDEFIYQYQSFCVWRTKVKNKTDEELIMLADGGQIWSSYSVLNVLYSLIQKSRINEHLAAVRSGASPEELIEVLGEYGSRPLYRNLGYFSIIGLLRVHVLLGDFTLALKAVDHIDLAQKSFFTRVTACHVATFYYVGFCYLALRRYLDATRIFVSILNFILRTKTYHTRSYQYDQISRTADRMYALLAICMALSPSRSDENILSQVKERYGEQYAKMVRGDEGLAACEELFLYACPKFIASNPPPYEDPQLLATYVEDPPIEPAQHHLSLFLSGVRLQSTVPTLRSFLKLYTSLDAAKLANFLDADEEELVQQMMVMKQCSRSISRAPGSEGVVGLLDGQTTTTSDLDFVIDRNMVHIVESTVGRRYGGWFIRNTEHIHRASANIRSSPLPIPKNTAKTETEAPPAAEAPPSRPKVSWAPSTQSGSRHVEVEA